MTIKELDRRAAALQDATVKPSDSGFLRGRRALRAEADYLSPPPRRRKKLSTTPTMTTSTMTVSNPRAMAMLR